MSDQDAEQGRAADFVSNVIRSRKTFKVLGDVESTVEFSDKSAEECDAIVLEAIKTAGWAPFHYDRAFDGLAEPWRAYFLKHKDCRKIAANFFDWFDGVKPTNKLPAMLSACGALVLVTWIPQFQNDPAKLDLDLAKSNESLEKQRQVDEEHLAATSAMVQNLLLILTAHGMGTYWSSGGQFRTVEMFDRLGVNSGERLLAAVFVEYPESQQSSLERLPGKQRSNRSEDAAWLRQISV